MKLASTVAKLSVVGVTEGEQIASVKSLLVDRKSKKVEYLNVVRGTDGVVPLMLPFKNILGIGVDYIIIQSAENIKKVYESQGVIEAAEEGLLLTGKTVLSADGDIVGKITDYAIEVKTGDIAKLLLDNGKEIPGEKLVTLSSNFIIANIDNATLQVAGELDEGSVAYLIGKVVNEDVMSDDGTFFIPSGTALTAELIAQAQKNDMMLAVTMAV